MSRSIYAATPPTFCQWVGETLSAANRRMLWIPPGFAHEEHWSYPKVRTFSTRRPTFMPLNMNEPFYGMTLICRFDGRTRTGAILSAKDLAGAVLETRCSL